MSVISKNIQKYMEIRGVKSVRELSEITKLHRNTLTNYIEGKAGINLETLAQIAKALKVEDSDLAQTAEPRVERVRESTPLEAIEIVRKRLTEAERLSPEFWGYLERLDADDLRQLEKVAETQLLKKGAVSRTN